MKKILLALLASIAISFSAFAAVNINTATQAELESLDGIGPVKAAAIIDYRKKNGGFKSVDELEKVNGVGPVTLAHVKKDVSITGTTTVVTPAKTEKADKKDAKADDKAAKTEKADKKDAKADDKAAKTEKADKKDAKADDKAAKDSDKEAAKKAKADEKAAKKAEKEAAKKAKADKADKKATDKK
jgi:competence protein ComEA